MYMVDICQRIKSLTLFKCILRKFEPCGELRGIVNSVDKNRNCRLSICNVHL